MNRMLIKSYELEIKVPRRILFMTFYKHVVLKFEQAKLIDTIEFFEITKQGGLAIIQWLLEFVKAKSGKMDKHIRRYIMGNREILFGKIKDTFFEGCFAEKEIKQKEEGSPYSAYITILCEKLQVDPITLANNYTPKQLEFLTEGLVWNANEQTKDGKKKNRLRLVKQKAINRTDEQQESIKNILSKL